jgi:hypothetical protein
MLFYPKSSEVVNRIPPLLNLDIIGLIGTSKYSFGYIKQCG